MPEKIQNDPTRTKGVALKKSEINSCNSSETFGIPDLQQSGILCQSGKKNSEWSNEY